MRLILGFLLALVMTTSVVQAQFPLSPVVADYPADVYIDEINNVDTVVWEVWVYDIGLSAADVEYGETPSSCSWTATEETALLYQACDDNDSHYLWYRKYIFYTPYMGDGLYWFFGDIGAGDWWIYLDLQTV